MNAIIKVSEFLVRTSLIIFLIANASCDAPIDRKLKNDQALFTFSFNSPEKISDEFDIHSMFASLPGNSTSNSIRRDLHGHLISANCIIEYDNSLSEKDFKDKSKMILDLFLKEVDFTYEIKFGK